MVCEIRRDVSPAFRITERTEIWSLHFKITDFGVTSTGRRYLKDDAIPSILKFHGRQHPLSENHHVRGRQAIPFLYYFTLARENPHSLLTLDNSNHVLSP